MKNIFLKLGKRSYPILVGSNIIKNFPKELLKLNIGNCAYIITNRQIKDKFSKTLIKPLLRSGFSVKIKTVADSEKSKSLKTAYSVIKGIARYDKQRKVFIIALGGGVIGDLSGFIASIYKRGIPYIQVPTTLLAQIDSAIGGKTAVDLTQGKNLAGSFYQPRLVLSDVVFLKSLPKRQVISGLAEAIKYGLIKDAKLFGYIEKNYKHILSKNISCLRNIVIRCSQIKADIVSKDEKEERNIRTLLNLGHTIGHSIEAAGGYSRYNHGEAVGLGIIAASFISFKLNLINNATLGRIRKTIFNIGLPVRLKGISLNKIIQAHYHDKKFSGKKNKFVVIKKVGNASIAENVPLPIIKEAVESLF